MSLHSINPEASLETLIKKAWSYIPKLKELSGYDWITIELDAITAQETPSLGMIYIAAATYIPEPRNYWENDIDLVNDGLKEEESLSAVAVLSALIKNIEEYIAREAD